MRGIIKIKKIFFLIISSVFIFWSCNNGVTAKEFVKFIKDETNGYTKTFQTKYGSQWKITLAPSEMMAVNNIKKNIPSQKEYEEALNSYSDMSYFIVETENEDRIQGFFCDNSILTGCNKVEYKALMCQEIYSMKGENSREYLVAFPKEIFSCDSQICMYLKYPERNLFEEIGCLDKTKMKTLPAVKTN